MNADTILTGALVLAGVGIAEFLFRARDRRARIERAVAELSFCVPQYMSYYSAVPGSPPVPFASEGYRSDYWMIREKTFAALWDSRFLPRWPNRHAKRIRKEADHLGAALAAAELRHQRGAPLSVDDQLAVTGVFAELREAVFGDTRSLDAEVREYVEHGF